MQKAAAGVRGFLWAPSAISNGRKPILSLSAKSETAVTDQICTDSSSSRSAGLNQNAEVPQ
jgi:hypothetical protein